MFSSSLSSSSSLIRNENIISFPSVSVAAMVLCHCLTCSHFQVSSHIPVHITSNQSVLARFAFIHHYILRRLLSPNFWKINLFCSFFFNWTSHVHFLFAVFLKKSVCKLEVFSSGKLNMLISFTVPCSYFETAY